MKFSIRDLLLATVAFGADGECAAVQSLGNAQAAAVVLAQRNGADNFSFLWETEGGIKLVTLVVGVGLLVFCGAIAWMVRNWKLAKLNDEYLRASRPQQHSVSNLLRAVKRKPAEKPDNSSTEEIVFVAETVSAPQSPFTLPELAPALSQGDWLMSRGLERLERELADGRRRRKTCQTCRYASAGGSLSCPYAFSCGVLHHPRGNLGHAVWKASLWFGFAIVLMAILLGLFAVIPMRNQQRTIGEALGVIWPGLLGLALLAAGISFVWHCWGGFKIRNQVRQAAQAAASLGLEFLNFQSLSLETGSFVLPLAVPGELNDVQAVMRGKLRGNEVFVGYYEYEWSERYGKNEFERKMAVARAAIGKEMHIMWGQLVMMFPEPLTGVADFQLSPRKDIDYHLLREAEAVPLRGRLAEKVEAIYCLTSRQIVGYLFDEPLQKFLLDHPGWNVQLLRGRLMLWHEKLDELSAEIIPGNSARLISDLEDATAWRQMLSAKGRADVLQKSLAEYRAAPPPKKDPVDERTAARRKYAEELRENIKPWQALALAIFFTCMGTGFAIAGFFDPNLEQALSLWLPLGLIPVVLLLVCIYIITIRN